ncbi:hypothetical protein [Ramlibacter sp.]|uniref:hypothetical protein n=1 Tax=Ramlibacter sp. TaxID=1917967 RepID=UPI0026230EE9|nr:hypothetical protein [Ramlibacter sp.]MDB5956489.1 hypothetical protein [Ramlibacter sp.]
MIRRLNTETMAILRQPQVRAELIALGTDPMDFGLNETAACMKSEVVQWAKAVKLAGVTGD